MKFMTRLKFDKETVN